MTLKLNSGNPLKIGIFGLDNAGKTTIVKIIEGERNLETLASLPPTIRVQIENLPLKDAKWVIWDFGGQQKYREEYLTEPQDFFDGLDFLVFVIDVQDSQRFDPALKYFTDCLEYYKRYSPQKPVLTFLHKVDPDLIKSPSLQANLRTLHRQVLSIAQEKGILIRIWSSTIFDEHLRIYAMMGGGTPELLQRKANLPKFLENAKKTHNRLMHSSAQKNPSSNVNQQILNQKVPNLKNLSLERTKIVEQFKTMLKKCK